eukprot:366119-Chlamydomonas_euryale.AAC.42
MQASASEVVGTAAAINSKARAVAMIVFGPRCVCSRSCVQSLCRRHHAGQNMALGKTWAPSLIPT